jgi:hypothetical protein
VDLQRPDMEDNRDWFHFSPMVVSKVPRACCSMSSVTRRGGRQSRISGQGNLPGLPVNVTAIPSKVLHESQPIL